MTLSHGAGTRCAREQVDVLMEDRKELMAQRAAAADAQKNQQAQSNAYLALMPLALPAPPTADYGGGPPLPPQQGFGPPPPQPPPGYGFQQQF